MTGTETGTVTSTEAGESLDDQDTGTSEILTTLEEYLQRNKENSGPIIITQREYTTNVIYKKTP